MLGHLFNRHKMVAGFGSFIVLTTLGQILFTLLGFNAVVFHVTAIHMTSNNIAPQFAAQLGIGYGILVTALQCGVYFAATNFILNKRLNLE